MSSIRLPLRLLPLALLLLATPATAQIVSGPCPQHQQGGAGRCIGNQPRHCTLNGQPGLCLTVNGSDCRCFKRVQGGQNTATTWKAKEAISIPAPGETIRSSFVLDTAAADTVSVVFFVYEEDVGIFESPPISGLVTLEGTRGAGADENVLKLESVGSLILSESVSIPGIGTTGLNELRYDKLSGTLDLETGAVELVGTGTITNELFGNGKPATFVSEQSGVLDVDSGVLTMTTIAADTPPSKEEGDPSG